MSHACAHIPSTRRAFTLIEMIVVIIIIGVTAALVLPRAFDGDAKRAEQTARAAASMLTAAAQREATSFDPVQLSYGRQEGTLEVMVLRGEGRDRAWKADLFIDPVKFGDAVLRSATLDGRKLDDKDWRVELPVNAPRPLITLEIAQPRGPGAARSWRVSLLPGASAARLTDLLIEPGPAGDDFQSVDLDAIGMGDRAW